MLWLYTHVYLLYNRSYINFKNNKHVAEKGGFEPPEPPPLDPALKLHRLILFIHTCIKINNIIESVDSISKDERGFPLTQYITNGRISRGGYTFTHFKHHHRVLRLICYSMSV